MKGILQDGNENLLEQDHLVDIFTMQDVITTMIIRAIRYEEITKGKFLGSLFRQMRNINTHLINYGGLFTFIVKTVDNEYFTFKFDHSIKRFIFVDVTNTILDVLDEGLREEDGPVTVNDIFSCKSTDELESMQKTYDSLKNLCEVCENTSFKKCKPHQTVWTSLAVKLSNREIAEQTESESSNEGVEKENHSKDAHRLQIKDFIMFSFSIVFTSQAKVNKKNIKHLTINEGKEQQILVQHLERLNKLNNQNNEDIENEFDKKERRFHQEISNFLLSYIHHNEFIKNLTTRMKYNRVNLFEKLERAFKRGN